MVYHIYAQLDATQRTELYRSFENANYFWVFLSFSMGLVSHYIRGHRWKFQMEAMGYNTSELNNFFAVMIGYIVNMALPRVGEVSRAAAITKYENIPFQKSFGTILSERAIDLIALMIISATTLFLQYALLRDFIESIKLKFKDIAGSPMLWLGILIIVSVVILGYFVFKRLKKRAFYAKVVALLEGLAEGLRSIFKMKRRWEYLLATLAIWGLYIGMFWVCSFSLPETANLGANAIFASFVIGSFAIVLIPGGIGAFPVGIMECLLLYGIAEETGFALGWILWLSQTALIVLVGGLSMILMPAYNKKRQHVAA